MPSTGLTPCNRVRSLDKGECGGLTIQVIRWMFIHIEERFASDRRACNDLGYRMLFFFACLVKETAIEFCLLMAQLGRNCTVQWVLGRLRRSYS